MVNQKTIEVERLKSGYLLTLNKERYAGRCMDDVMYNIRLSLDDLVSEFVEKKYQRMSVELIVKIDERIVYD